MRIDPRVAGLSLSGARIERALAAFGMLGVALGLLTGCPGELADKESFLLYPNGLAGAGGGAVHGKGPSGGGPSGGGPSGGGPSGGPGDCGDVAARVLIPNCGGSGCHGDVAPQQDLDLVSPGVASRLVGISGKICNTVLVDPMNPENSLMYQKLSANPTCGAQMPLARPPLSSADTACLRAWIAAQ